MLRNAFRLLQAAKRKPTSPIIDLSVENSILKTTDGRRLRLKTHKASATTAKIKNKYQKPAWTDSVLQIVTNDIHSAIKNASNNDKFTEKALSSMKYFDGKGKQIRPLMILMMGNFLNGNTNIQDPNIRRIAVATEMLHAASLMHDDVLDESLLRRNNPTLNAIFNESNAILIGNFIVGEGWRILAKTGNPKVLKSFSTAMSELIHGELVQIAGSEGGAENKQTKKGQNEYLVSKVLSFDTYIEKSYLKTGALMANTLKATAQVTHPKNEQLHNHIFNFGKSVGIAFQIIDDCLDFIVDSEISGKPSQGADLSLGIITAPVMFAAQENANNPEEYSSKINEFIDKKFKKHEKDQFQCPEMIQETVEIVKKCGAIEQSRKLADIYAADAIFELGQVRSILKAEGPDNKITENIDKAFKEIEELVSYILSRVK